MSSAPITTITRMVESLPEAAQHEVVEHLRHYVQELRDQNQWESSFEETQPQLSAAAKRARREIANGDAKPMDYNEL